MSDKRDTLRARNRNGKGIAEVTSLNDFREIVYLLAVGSDDIVQVGESFSVIIFVSRRELR